MINFPCPHCKAGLEAPHGAAGTLVCCDRCGRGARVPGGRNTSGVTICADGSFQFPCPECGATLAAAARTGGGQTVCPACHAITAVPNLTPTTLVRDRAGGGITGCGWALLALAAAVTAGVVVYSVWS